MAKLGVYCVNYPMLIHFAHLSDFCREDFVHRPVLTPPQVLAGARFEDLGMQPTMRMNT